MVLPFDLRVMGKVAVHLECCLYPQGTSFFTANKGNCLCYTACGDDEDRPVRPSGRMVTGNTILQSGERTVVMAEEFEETLPAHSRFFPHIPVRGMKGTVFPFGGRIHGMSVQLLFCLSRVFPLEGGRWPSLFLPFYTKRRRFFIALYSGHSVVK